MELKSSLLESGRATDWSDVDEVLGIQQLVRSAAHAADCPIGALYVEEAGGITLAAAYGIEAPATLPRQNWVLNEVSHLLPGQVFAVSDIAYQSDAEPGQAHVFGDQRAPMRSLVAVRVPEGASTPQGVLIVADPAPHPGLSSATMYVLITHAAQIRALWTTQAMERLWAGAQRHQHDTERLRLLESVVVNANDAVLITKAEPIDEPGPEIVYCNAAFTRTTGYEPHEVIGMSPRVLQAAGTDRQALDRLRAALIVWQPIEVELLNRRKDGTEFWVELSIAPVADERGWYTHWVSVQRDVTDRKRAAADALRARDVEAEKLVLETEIRERRRVEEQLTYAAFHDDLTKLHNRAYFMSRLRGGLETLGRGGCHRCSVLFMDLDRFKLINDSLGHHTGDLLLMEVANRLRSCVRPEDTLARISGDEFALIVEAPIVEGPNVEGSDGPGFAVAMAERIIAVMRAPIWLGRQEVFCSFSVGVVEASEQHASPEDLLRDADTAMYAAKRAEPGSYAVFAPPMRDGVVEALRMRTDLRNAVAGRDFHLVYQPICDAASRRMKGVEALIRWTHPDNGVIDPATFIPLAEETGLIREIGRWVLNEACRQMRAWRDRFPALDLRLSVNVSGVQLRDLSFRDEVQAALAATGIRPQDLELEITENVFLPDPQAAGALLGSLRGLGVRIALDDFGTGYSALGFLDSYPMDTLKIDRSFTSRMMDQPRTMAIVGRIVQLGHALNLQVVGEGVEGPEQLAALLEVGCDSVQGYMLGRPMAPAQIEALAAQAHSAACLAELGAPG